MRTLFKKLLLAALLGLSPLSLPSAQGQTNTWTFVQEAQNSYCVPGQSSCSFSAGTLAPTTAGTVRIIFLRTANASNAPNVTISSVSGLGSTWNLCPASSCHILGNDDLDMAYAIGGTGGQLNGTITLSGNSGTAFFTVILYEFLPPAGATASFDTSGTVQSNCTSGSATGVGLGLTPSNTDLIFTGRGNGDPSGPFAYSAPYVQTPYNNAFNLNTTSGTAPTMGCVGSTMIYTAMAFKTSAGLFTPPTKNMKPVNYTNNNDVQLTCSPTCSLTIPASTAGNLLFLEAADINAAFISAVSDSQGDSWVVPGTTGSSTCRNTVSGTNDALSCAWVLVAKGGTTSLSITMSANGAVQFAVMEVHSALAGNFALDAQGSTQNTASFNPSGQALAISGSDDVVFQAAFIPGGTTAQTYYPMPPSSPKTGQEFWLGQAGFVAVLDIPYGQFPSNAQPTWGNQQDNATLATGVAFKVAQTINAATCNSSDVQTALNSVSVDNTTINVPAGSCTWSGTGPVVTYNQAFSTAVIGQGKITASDGFNNPSTYNDQTIICDLVSTASNETLRIVTAANKTFRLTGFSFASGCGQSTARNTGVINILGDGHLTRIDHNHFTGVQGPRFLNIASGDVWGVTDHNLFDEATAFTENFVEVNGANYAASGDSFGDASWTDVSNFGTGNFMFVENNSFVCTVSTGCRSYDLEQGGRVVFRNNTNKNSSLQEHNIGHDGPTFRDRGPRASEIYNNNFSWPNGGAPFAFLMDYEGGTSLWYKNTVTAGAYNNFINIDYRRATGFTYTQNQPPNGWGYCGTTQTGPNGSGPSIWDENFDSTGSKCIDGLGMGKGDLLTGNSWPSVNNNVTGTQTWLRQTRDPMYVWLNTTPGISNQIGSGQGDISAVNNRDYYFDAASFNGTTGVGNGTLAPSTIGAYTNAPSCTNGVAYWRTTTNTLYQCQAAWGTMDVWLPMAHGTLSAVVTSGGLNTDAKGPAVSWALNPATPTGMTFNVSQGDMGGSITVAGTTYPYGTATQAVALNGANNFTYATGTVSSGQRIVVGNGFLTVNAANAGFNGHNWDFFILTSADSSATVVLQFNNGAGPGSCYCLYVETNGGSGFIGRSTSTIAIAAGHRYAFSLLFDETNGTAKLALFDPSNGFAQVGSTITQAQETGQNFAGLRFGNAETGTSTGPTFFEDIMLDWTNHVFPNAPVASWQVYYTPFTYPHPLVGNVSTLAPPTNLRVIPSVQPLFLF